MTAALALVRAEAAGVRFRLDGDAVRMEADAPPRPELVAELRRHRDEIAAMLAGRDGDRAPALDHDADERAAMGVLYAAAADPEAWRPGTPDALRDGLLVGASAPSAVGPMPAAHHRPAHGAPAAPGTAAPAAGVGGTRASRAAGGAGPAIHLTDYGR